ncbi:SDR family oxidoreductase [Streptomyces sp. NPDC000877]|uniref:SDR family oxidoreductase n=1 Tax=unclassified Streptomyces TaxID=2593676 RepID=UPI0033336134
MNRAAESRPPDRGVVTGTARGRARSRRRHIPLRRAGLPDEVLNAVVLLATDETSYITGAGLVGDWSTVLPGSPV